MSRCASAAADAEGKVRVREAGIRARSGEAAERLHSPLSVTWSGARCGGEGVRHVQAVQMRLESSGSVHKSLVLSILYSRSVRYIESRTVHRSIPLPPILMGGIMVGDAIPEENAKNQAPWSPP